MNSKELRVRPSLMAASGLYLLAAVALVLLSVTAPSVGQQLRHIWPNIGEETLSLITDLMYYVPFVILPALMWAQKNGGFAQNLRLNPVRPGTMLRIVVIAVASMILVQNVSILWNVLWQKLGLNVFAYDDLYHRPDSAAQLTTSLLSAAMLAPLAEELLFRGVMLPAWSRRGTRCAVLVTSVLFAMLHGSLLGLPGEIFGGVMMALLVLWTDSLWAGVMFHTVFNAAAVFVNYLSTEIPMEAAEEALMHSDLFAYMGGAAGAMALVVDGVLMWAIISAVSHRLRLFCVLRRLTEEGEKMAPRSLVVHPGWFGGAPVHEERQPLTSGEILVLMSGIGTMLLVYGMDFMTMLGG